MMYRNEKFPFPVKGESERKSRSASSGSFHNRAKKSEQKPTNKMFCEINKLKTSTKSTSKHITRTSLFLQEKFFKFDIISLQA